MGGRLYKGNVLAPFVSMVIHGLLDLLSSLALFEKKVVYLENIKKKELDFVMIQHSDIYKVLSLKKCEV